MKMRFKGSKRNMAVISIILILFVLCSFLSRKGYDYVFYVAEIDTYVYTKKKLGGNFLIMFSRQKDNIGRVSNMDHVEVSTGSYVSIMFDPADKKTIAIIGEKEITANRVDYNLMFTGNQYSNYYSFKNIYFDESRPRKPYIWMHVSTLEYDVMLNGKVLHDGGFWGR